MQVVVTCEFRFFQTPDGKVWTPSAFTADFWLRYLAVFERVKVVARIQAVETAVDGWQRSDRDNVCFVGLPYYVGFTGLLRNARAIVNTLSEAVSSQDALIYRVPSQTSTLALLLRRTNLQHFAVEVVGDPADVFDAGITHSILDKLLGFISAKTLRSMCKRAIAASYVTKAYLQERYPVKESVFQTACSSIELDPKWLTDTPKEYSKPASKLLFIGSFGQLYKGQDTLLKAIALLQNRGLDLELTMLGGGLYVKPMQALAAELGIEQRVTFCGEVNAQQVKQSLDDAELFVMPSRTEGLPRALIEAMATGLPAIGSKVGGIPELLPEQHLFVSDDSNDLADRLEALATSTEKLNQASKLNIETASGYEKSLLASRREAFYSAVKQAFEVSQ